MESHTSPELSRLKFRHEDHMAEDVQFLFHLALRCACTPGISRTDDVQLLIDLVVAPFFYRRLMALSQVRTSDVEPVVDAVLRAFTAVPATSG